jgi:Tfp pilus assembly protein PilX
VIHRLRRSKGLPRGSSRFRRGFVLVAALVALVLIALLITGAFFASGQQFAVAGNELRDQQAFAYAEYAIAHSVGSWNGVETEAMTVGQTISYTTVSDAPLESTVFITKLDTALYAIVAEGRVQSADTPGWRRRLGIIVRTVRDGATVNPPVRVTEQAWSELY